MKTIAIVLCAVMGIAHAAVPDSWIKSDSGKICGGIVQNCTNKEDCSMAAVGYCKDPNGTAASDMYIASHFQGLAFVQAAKYIDAATNATLKVIESSGAGFRDFASNNTVGNAKYAYTMVGNYFGSDAEGGYAGIASYLNTGKNAISINENTFYYATGPSATRITRGDSKLAAPKKSIACISPISGTTCGAKRTFPADSYKFSIFGYVKGSNWTKTYTEFKDTKKFDHMGVRMKYTLKGAKASTLTFNGGSTIAAMKNKDIDSLHFKVGTKDIYYSFPKKYNYGEDADKQDADNRVKINAKHETKNVKIRVSSVSGDAQSIYIDYLFEFGGSKDYFKKAFAYFVYDPDVSTVKPASVNPSIQVSLSGAFALIAMAFALRA